MTNSKTIAGLIGPTLVAIAAGMLLNIGSFRTLAELVSRDPALIFVAGILLFVAGLRAKEIAHLTWWMTNDSQGEVGRSMCLLDSASKGEVGQDDPAGR